MELRRGAKSAKELDVLEGLFKSIEYFPTKEEYYAAAGDLGRLLLRKGLSIRTLDLLIAQIAISNDVFLLTLDNRFTEIARHTALKLY